MLLELGVPQGQVVSRWKGGEGVITGALERVKNASFTGYLKVGMSREGERSEGLISFASGAPSLALYVFQPMGMEELWFVGEKALDYTWADSLQVESVVSLHGDVLLKDFEHLFPQARIRKVEAPKTILKPAQLREDKLRCADPEYTGEKVLGVMARRTGEADRRRVDQQAQGVYDLILQYHKMRSNGSGISECKDCGGPIDLLGYCPSCASQAERSRPVAPRMEPRFSFDSFVVGQNARFADAAARAVAADPGHLYNPLLIHGKSGLGKTHLLQAIGHHLKGEKRSTNVAYLPLEALEEQVISSIVSRSGEVRQEMEQADLLLIDDIQFLSGREKLQEEMLRTINLLISRGKQVVLTCDRPLKEVPSLSERLTSRVESGLVVDVQQPDAATRVAILKKVVADEGLDIPEEVMAFVAEMCPDNVRQLEGGMNRVIAFASLMRSDVSLDIAREVLGHEKVHHRRKRADLQLRRSYLVQEVRPDHSYDLLAAKLDKGFKGLVFSRSNPSAIRERLDGRSAEVYWLTEHESREERTIPPSLEKIILKVEQFLNQDGETIVLLDDLHYLISNATFDGVIRFVRSVVDQVSERQAIFVLSISPDSLKLQERSILEREMESLKF